MAEKIPDHRYIWGTPHPGTHVATPTEQGQRNLKRKEERLLRQQKKNREEADKR